MSDPFDETALRRALRLDADELPPRLDPRRVAALADARAERVRARWAAASFAAALALSAAGVAQLLVAPDLLGAAIDAIARVAPAAEAIEPPTATPLAVLLVASLAIACELDERRRMHRARIRAS